MEERGGGERRWRWRWRREEVEEVEVEERGGSRGGGERRRWRRRREAEKEVEVEKRGRGGGERWRWRWSDVAERSFCCRDREVCTLWTTTWGVAHGGKRRRYPARWTSTGMLGRPTKRIATTQQSKVKAETMKEAEVKTERLGVKAEVEEEMKAEAETIKETEVERRWSQR